MEAIVVVSSIISSLFVISPVVGGVVRDLLRR
jgi:hypothetical protein